MVRKLLYFIVILISPVSLYAHHFMEDALPSTFSEGFLSGLVHPVIGLDHFIFILALSCAIAFLDNKRMKHMKLLSLFYIINLLGILFHLQSYDIFFNELVIAFSIIIIGLSFLLLNNVYLLIVCICLGFFHGYAYGESIVGAEQTPLLAYLIGFTIIQLALSIILIEVIHTFLKRFPLFRFITKSYIASSVILIGIIFVYLALQ